MYMAPTPMPPTLVALLAQPTGSSEIDSAISVSEDVNSVRIGDQTVVPLPVSPDLVPTPVVGNLPPPPVDEAVLDRSIFGDLPIIHVVKKMAMLMLPRLNGQVGSAIPMSYSRTASWDKFTVGQKGKVRQAWLKCLTEAQRVSVRAEIQVTIDSALAQAAHPTPVTRSPNTNHDDRARLVEMLKDPAHSTIWAQTNEVLERDELDRSQEDRLRPFETLAERFNDPEGFPYSNALLDSTDAPNTAKFGDIADQACVQFDPACLDRPKRDGGWIQKTLRDFKAPFTKIYNNYVKSGNQDSEYPYLEFMDFCLGDQMVFYCFCTFGPEAIKELVPRIGKMLPENAQRDSGIRGEPDSGTPGGRHKTKGRRRGDNDNSSTSTPTSALKIIRIERDARSVQADRINQLVQGIKDADVLGLNADQKNALRAEYIKLMTTSQDHEDDV